MNRGARHRDMFFDDEDRRLFLSLLPGIRKRFGTRLVSYCLMGNHYHLVVHCPEPALSQSMQWLGSIYVRRFNQRHGFDGPLWRSRFKDVPILDDTQLATVVRYIHRNPLDLGWSGDLGDYMWSSHGAYIDRVSGPWWLDTDVPLELYGNDRQSFQRSVETPLLFDSVQNRPAPTRTNGATDRLNGYPQVRLFDIQSAVESSGIGQPKAGRFDRHRGVALLLAVDVFGLDADDVVDAFEFASIASMRRAVQRARGRVVTDPTLATLLHRVRASLIDDVGSTAA